MKKLIGKSFLIWAAMIPLAIANGALREFVLLPLLGRAAQPLSGLLLCGMLYLIVWLFLPRLGTAAKRTYQTMGLLWAVATILFETLLGLAGGDAPAVILNNYNLATGNLWLLVVLFFGFTPWLVAKRQGLID